MKRGFLVNEILRALDEAGPMTRSEICEYLGFDKNDISRVVTRLNRRTPQAGKRIYVKGYTYDHEGEKRYPRAIYALGDRQNAPKPKPADKAAMGRERRARRRTLRATNSVFNLGLTQFRMEKRIAA